MNRNEPFVLSVLPARGWLGYIGVVVDLFHGEWIGAYSVAWRPTWSAARRAADREIDSRRQRPLIPEWDSKLFAHPPAVDTGWDSQLVELARQALGVDLLPWQAAQLRSLVVIGDLPVPPELADEDATTHNFTD